MNPVAGVFDSYCNLLHPSIAQAAEPVDIDTVRVTLGGLIDSHNRDRITAGKLPLPHKNSVGWVYSFFKKAGLQQTMTKSTEEKAHSYCILCVLVLWSIVNGFRASRISVQYYL